MSTWTSALLDEVAERLHGHPFWEGRLREVLDAKGSVQSIHLGIFVEPLLQYVLEGKKRVEARFSVHRCAPYQRVGSRDVLLLKRSSGPVVAIAEISHVWFYHLDKRAWSTIKSRFAPLLCVDDPRFWESKASSCYATLMRLEQVDRFSPIPCSKRDRRGWVVLERGAAQASLFDNGGAQTGRSLRIRSTAGRQGS